MNSEADKYNSLVVNFDGVFGASGKVLGSIESGVDLERRILDIYQQYRVPWHPPDVEISSAFKQTSSPSWKRSSA